MNPMSGGQLEGSDYNNQPVPSLTGGRHRRGRKTRHHRKHATKSYAGGRKRKSRKAKRSRRKH